MLPSAMHLLVVLGIMLAVGSLARYFFNKRHPPEERAYPLGAALRMRYMSVVFIWVGAFFCVFFLLQLVSGQQVNYGHLLGLVAILVGWLSRKFSTHWIEWERRRLG